MKEQDRSLELAQGQSIEPATGSMFPETPEDYGFPSNPDATQVRSWERQELFLVALAASGSVGAAAAESGVSLGTVDSWGSRDTQGFKKRKELALQQYLGVVEREIHRRGIEGIEKPVFWKGVQVATVKEYDPQLLMFRAKRIEPAYRDNFPAPVQDNSVHITKVTYQVHQSPRSPEPAPAEVTEATARELEPGEDDE